MVPSEVEGLMADRIVFLNGPFKGHERLEGSACPELSRRKQVRLVSKTDASSVHSEVFRRPGGPRCQRLCLVSETVSERLCNLKLDIIKGEDEKMGNGVNGPLFLAPGFPNHGSSAFA